MNKNILHFTLACIFSAVLSLCIVLPASGGTEISYQQLPIRLNASDILPQDWLFAPNYRIEEAVMNDGFVNTYKLNTDEGTLTIESTAMLKTRINELKALQHMEALKQTKVFQEGFEKSLMAPIRTVKGLATEPVQTVKGTVTGIGRWFSDVGRSVTSKDPYQENVLKTAIGYAAAKRKFAYEYGIDPYTSYEPVQKQLAEVARVGFAGGLTPKLAFQAVPKAAKIALSTTSTADGMKRLVRDSAPAELEKINRKKLSAMGVSEPLINIFLTNENYNPQEATLLVGELDNMKGLTGRKIFIATASLADSESVAKFMRLRAEMMANYMKNVAPANAIIELNGIPMLKRKDGVVVGLFPLDYVAWTAGLWRRESAVSAITTVRPDITGKELWVEGSVDPMARKALEAKGWTVVEKVEKKTYSKIGQRVQE